MNVLESLEDAHIDLIERVSSYYAHYVDTMWNIAVLDSKSIVGKELWPAYMDQFEEAYGVQIEFEYQLCQVISREDGIDTRIALDELHEELEHNFHIELLAQRDMTILIAESLERWSRLRLARQAALRKHIRYCIDIAQFHVSDVAAKQERHLSRVEEIAHASLAVMKDVYPRVVLL